MKGDGVPHSTATSRFHDGSCYRIAPGDDRECGVAEFHQEATRIHSKQLRALQAVNARYRMEY